MNNIFKFKSYSLARSLANRAVKAQAVMLGDDGMFWVVSLAQMERLLKAGYELAD